ncbi:MAG: DUF3108 domain-containing protein [Proteobacteria bacterium]|nr:DUF3108 domain-containing protein [Pseudomonadota bacterium]
MAGKLTRPGTWSLRRRLAFALLVAVVVIGHAWVTRDVAARMQALEDASRMPPRLEVVYVRELEPVAPPVVAAGPPAPVPKPRPARAPHARPPAAASAAEPADDSASAVAEAVSAPAPAASDNEPATLADAASAAASDIAPAASAPAPALAAAEPASEPASGAAPFAWPVSTRVSFTLDGNYRGQVQGDAQVEWVRAGSRYQVHLDLTIGPSFAPLISRRMTSDGELRAEGLVPQRYDQDTQVAFGGSPRHVAMHFDESGVTLANGERRATLPGIQDMSSQFIQLSYWFATRPGLLAVGNHIDVPLGLPHRVDRWTYDVVDEDTVYTTFGPLAVLHLKPRPGPFRAGDLVPEIWFAPELRYLPVRIRIRQDETANFIDLVIAKKPELAAR